MYLNDKDKPYGIPGLPGIYTGGPGEGSGLKNSNSAPKTGGDTGAAQAANAGPKAGGAERAQIAGAAGATAHGVAPATPSAGRPAQPAASEHPMHGTIGQPSAGALTQLQQQASASQAVAAAPVLEDASAKAGVGFNQPIKQNSPLAAIPEPASLTGTTPALLRAPEPAATSAHVTPPSPVTSALSSAPATSGMDEIKAYLFPATPPPPKVFPKNPGPLLTNSLREEQRVQAELKAWDDWALQRATRIHDDSGDKLYPADTEAAVLNASAVSVYAPELLVRYRSDAVFRRSVDERLRYTNEHVALDYYQGLAEAHKAAILAFQAELEKLAAVGKIDKLVPLEEQYKSHPERRQIVQAIQNRVSSEEQAAVTKAQAESRGKLDKEYQGVFGLIRAGATTRR